MHGMECVCVCCSGVATTDHTVPENRGELAGPTPFPGPKGSWSYQNRSWGFANFGARCRQAVEDNVGGDFKSLLCRMHVARLVAALRMYGIFVRNFHELVLNEKRSVKRSTTFVLMNLNTVESR